MPLSDPITIGHCRDCRWWSQYGDPSYGRCNFSNFLNNQETHQDWGCINWTGGWVNIGEPFNIDEQTETRRFFALGNGVYQEQRLTPEAMGDGQ